MCSAGQTQVFIARRPCFRSCSYVTAEWLRSQCFSTGTETATWWSWVPWSSCCCFLFLDLSLNCGSRSEVRDSQFTVKHLLLLCFNFLCFWILLLVVIKHDTAVLHGPLWSGNWRDTSFYKECIICNVAASSFHYEILHLEQIIIGTVLVTLDAPLGLALPFRQFNTYVGLNWRTRRTSRHSRYYQAHNLSSHDLIPAFPVGIVHQANSSPLSGSVLSLQGSTIANIIYPLKWSFASCSQHILRHHCVIVWIFSEDNSD